MSMWIMLGPEVSFSSKMEIEAFAGMVATLANALHKGVEKEEALDIVTQFVLERNDSYPMTLDLEEIAELGEQFAASFRLPEGKYWN